MKKKTNFGVFLLLILAIGSIIGGFQYQRNQRNNLEQKSLVQAATSSTSKETSETEEESNETSEIPIQEKVSGYESRLENLTPVEYLDYIALTEGSPTIAFYGDVSEASEWSHFFVQALNEEISEEVAVEYASYPDLDSYELHIQETAYQVSERSPDVLFFRPDPVADRTRDIGTAETETYLEYVLHALRNNFPDTKIVMVETHFQPGEENTRNSRSLTYRSYAETMASLAEEGNMLVLEAIEAMSQEYANNGEEYFQSDQKTLSQAGHHYYAAQLLEQIK